MIRIVSFGLLFFLVSLSAFAQESYRIHSGTGFFVSQSGHIITNDHVVKSCSKITVRGAVAESEATLLANDPVNDLALLQVGAVPPHIASLRGTDSSITKGEPAVVMGYPEEHGITGDYVVQETSVVDAIGPLGQEQWLQFADAAKQGNSGGPLLDESGNVIGVVVGKSKVMTDNPVTGREVVAMESDLAITLPRLKAFLDANRVYYRTGERSINLSADRIATQAKGFIVNVHCVEQK